MRRADAVTLAKARHGSVTALRFLFMLPVTVAILARTRPGFVARMAPDGREGAAGESG
jgi:hypothetical protein